MVKVQIPRIQIDYVDTTQRNNDMCVVFCTFVVLCKFSDFCLLVDIALTLRGVCED